MAQPEYKDIRDGDWQNLRQFVRRVNERLSVLEGYSGESKRLANLLMDGNQIRNGPWHQTSAEQDEFITKYFLDNQMAISRNMDRKSQIISSVTVEDVIPGPITMTDFSLASGFWLPVYCKGNNGGTGTMVFNADGSVDIEAMGPDVFALNQQFVMGVRPRFRVIPDANQEITLRVKYTNHSWDSRISGDGYTFFGMILHSIINDSTGGHAWIGQGVVGPFSNSLDSVATGEISSNISGSITYKAVTTLNAKDLPINVRWSFGWSGTPNPKRFSPLLAQYERSGFHTVAMAASPDAGYLNSWSGIAPTLGVFQRDQEHHKAKLVEFAIEKGILVKGLY